MTANHSANRLPPQRTYAFLRTTYSIMIFALVTSASSLFAQIQVFSRSDSGTDLWENNSNLPWAYPSSINRSRPDLEWGGQTRHFVIIGHNNNTTMNVNGNTWYGLRTLTLQASAGSNRTFNRDGSAGISLTEGFYNDVNATQTFNVPIGVDGATVAFAGSTTNGSTTFTTNIFLNGNTAAFNSSGNFTLSGPVTGTNASAKITKTGSGTLTLSGTNSYSGGTTLNGGTLQFAKTSSMSSAGAVAVGTGSTLAVNVGGAGEFSIGTNVANGSIGGLLGGLGGQSGGTVSYAAIGEVTLGLDTSNAGSTAQDYNGTIVNVAVDTTLGIKKLGSGTVTLSGTTANTYTGLTTVSGGTLNLNKDADVNAIAGAVRVDSGAVLLLSASNQVASDAGDTVTLSGGTIRRGGNVSEVFGNLNLTTTSFLDYGESNGVGTIRFGTYTPSSLLTVQNFLPGNKLQFGVTLTEAQLSNSSLFSFSSGFTTGTEDGFFTITAIPEPSTYVAAAGLLAMFLWPVRRRMIKDLKSILGLRPTGRERIEAYRNA
jgi:autotransporter-associated beta strand protein